MDKRSGLTFADILILVAIILLFIALAIPLFRQSREMSEEEITGRMATNRVAGATNAPSAAP
jgi:Tfp pilus assembly protein FimT